MRWPSSAVQFIPAIALMDEAQRRNVWPAVRAVLSRDQDVWDRFLFEGGVSTDWLAENLVAPLGIDKADVPMFAREAIGRRLRD